MKLCRFKASEKISFGVIEGDSVFEIKDDPFAAGFSGEVKKGTEHKLDKVRLLAPVLPSKIVAIGLNYKAHAAEFGKPLPEEPMIFIKPSTSVIGPEDEIVYPGHMSHRVDYEGSLASSSERPPKRFRYRAPRNISSGIPALTMSQPATSRARTSSIPGQRALILSRPSAPP